MTLAPALVWLCLSRAGTCMAAMAYAGALPFLRDAWVMDSASAGSVQSVYNITNAVALLIAAWASGRWGARRIYLISAYGAVLSMTAFALFARSGVSAAALAVPLAVTQGGTYAPAMILIAEMVARHRRGRAMGAMLAAGSFGYLASVLAAMGGAALLDYRWGFALCATGPILGAVAAWRALRHHPNIRHDKTAPSASQGGWGTRAAILLTLGYAAHCWELLGSWTWMPSFLAAALAPLGLAPLMLGFLVACAVHGTGMLATFSVGFLSDVWGRRRVLLGVAALGAGLSLTLGWSLSLGPWVVLILAMAASFFILGDSGVLSTAMTESVPPARLGAMLAVRSLLGFGAGAISPALFGLVLDGTGTWGWSFAVLGLGGLVAALAAAALPKRRGKAETSPL